ncbi:MAG TPA: hypothetical protein VFE13_03205 [Caulobacteraceae bacterium]|jgi:hypothetical protein|nr:hypothetical protein [Caulobacteraceae bacterium]
MAIRFAVALAVVLTCGAATSPDGFAAFWPSFAAAAAKDDAKALAAMTALGPGLGDNGDSFAKFHARNLGPAVRRCLAAAKPTRDIDGNGHVEYGAFCGHVIYVFSKHGAAWRLTDLGVDD